MALLLLPVLIWAAWACRAKTTPDCELPAVREARNRASWVLGRVPRVLLVLAMGCLLLALCGPAWTGGVQKGEEAAKLVLVLDLSGSMEARELLDASACEAPTLADLSLPRIELAKEAGVALLERWQGQAALVAFARRAYLASPFNRRVAMERARGLAPLFYEDGTAIGDALCFALDSLGGATGADACVALISDGADHASEERLREAVAKACKMAVPIHALCVGTDNGYHPVMDANGMVAWKAGGEKKDERLLKRLAEATGGQFVQLKTSADASSLKFSPQSSGAFGRLPSPVVLLAWMALLLVIASQVVEPLWACVRRGAALACLWLCLGCCAAWGQELDLNRAASNCRIGGSNATAGMQALDNGTRCLRLSTVFVSSSQGRTTWDIPVSVNLTQVAGIRLRLLCLHPEIASQFNVYLQNGGSWYAASFEIEADGRWEDVYIPKTRFMPEGAPTSWRNCTTLRIAAWRGAPGALHLFVQSISFVRANASVAILRGTSKNTAEALRHASNLNEGLLYCGLRPAVIDETDASFSILRPYKMVLVPSLAHLGTAQQESACTYIGEGGKLGLFHSLPPRVASRMNLPVGKFMLASTLPGALGGIIPDASHLGGLGTTRQLSTAFIGVGAVPTNANYVAWWATGRGQRTKWPAVIENPWGFWMTHVYLNQDPAHGGPLLVSLINRKVQDAWQCGSATLLAATRASVAFAGAVERCNALPALNKAEHAYATGRYLEVVTRCHEAREQLAVVAGGATASNPLEIRGVWCRYPGGLPGHTWSQTLMLLKRNDFNAVFTLAASPFAAHYPSRILPQGNAAGLPDCVEAAASLGFRVHAWINCLGIDDAPPMVIQELARQGRLQVGPNGEILKWLCPNHRENRELLSRMVVELVYKYKVEGVHFDRIRYPGRESCYCQNCKAAFAAYLGLRPEPWPSIVRGGEYHEKWNEFRRLSINAVLNEMTSAALTARKNLYVSAAVYPDWLQARNTVGQDWCNWCRRRQLSFVCPMNYHGTTTAFQGSVKRQVAQLGGGSLLLPGIGTGPARLSADELARQIQVARNSKCAGFVVFDLGQREAMELFPKLNQKK